VLNGPRLLALLNMHEIPYCLVSAKCVEGNDAFESLWARPRYCVVEADAFVLN
jgi:hypothetical protein